MNLEVQPYHEALANQWDRFVLAESINGTFLQTRNFLNYHPHGRFADCSILIRKGDALVAAIPACSVEENGRQIFYSHAGATFGGVVLDGRFYNSVHLEAIMQVFMAHLHRENFDSAVIKITPQLFSKARNDLLSYFLFKEGFKEAKELSLFIDFSNYCPNILDAFNSSKRRDFRYAEKHSMEFNELTDRESIASFYTLLRKNLLKHHKLPVHTLNELSDFKEKRLKDAVRFYGVCHGDKVIAGSMVFLFGKTVFHTQYLVMDYDFKKMFPMVYLIKYLIETARREFPYFSFGISTEERGSVLNLPLVTFKEEFGAMYENNMTYYMDLE